MADRATPKVLGDFVEPQHQENSQQQRDRVSTRCGKADDLHNRVEKIDRYVEPMPSHGCGTTGGLSALVYMVSLVFSA